MKFKVLLSPNREVVPFDYMHKLTGVFHYWLGPNDLHGILSLYSISMLQGGTLDVSKAGFNFPEGAWWEIGIHNAEIAERLIKGLLLKPPVFYGMEVRKVERLRAPEFRNRKFVFRANSPILLRKNTDKDRREFVLFDHPEATLCMHRVMDHKLEAAGLKDKVGQYALYFDAGFNNPKTKLIRYKETDLKGSVCPVVAIGSSEFMDFAWSVGVGELTGSGFGSMGVGSPASSSRHPRRTFDRAPADAESTSSSA
jgi:CRISPR-associated endoribonuclease Cas6